MHVNTLLLLSTLALLAMGCRTQPEPPTPSEYVGQEDRAVKSLSNEDIDDLLNGRGWGFAKAAELNGIPGPMHVLELKEHMRLTDRQLTQIEKIRSEMRSAAASLGSTFVAVEKTINDRFARKDIDAETLRQLLDRSADVRSELAFTHLHAHLRTVDILTPEQVATYNLLRGYETVDPCSNVPAGHDPEMWRRHNSCD